MISFSRKRICNIFLCVGKYNKLFTASGKNKRVSKLSEGFTSVTVKFLIVIIIIIMNIFSLTRVVSSIKNEQQIHTRNKIKFIAQTEYVKEKLIRIFYCIEDILFFLR